jgi:hypothetical protein
MGISQYWVGQIPARPIAIDVKDSDGFAMNLASYVAYKVVLVGSDNEVIDTTGSVLLTSGAVDGRFVFQWPKDRSLFNKPGEYLLQMEIDGLNGSKDFTTEHHIRVRKLGGKN